VSKKKRRPLDAALYAAVIAEAKERFAVWPSAYASGWVVQTYKARGGRYSDERDPSEGIAKWFDEEWVDLSRPIHDDDGNLIGYEPCGRAQSSQRAYPKCRPKAEAMRMTPEEVLSAIRRKRAVEVGIAPHRGRSPVNVPTYTARANPSYVIPGDRAECDCGWGWDVEADDDDPLMCHKCWGQYGVRVYRVVGRVTR